MIEYDVLFQQFISAGLIAMTTVHLLFILSSDISANKFNT